MLIQTRHAHHRCLLRLLQKVTGCQSGPIRVRAMAEMAGFSRAHLTRVFRDALGESPADLERRIRLERAAYLLRERDTTIAAAAEEAGYATPEAFTRAFRQAYGLLPSEYERRDDLDWKLPSPSGVHWQVEGKLRRYCLAGQNEQALVVEDRPSMFLIAKRHVGSYRDHGVTWQKIEKELQGRPWDRPSSRLLTLYHDDSSLYPDDTLRSDLGYTADIHEEPPAGFHRIRIPGGVYVASKSLLNAEQHYPCWEGLLSEWLPRMGRRPVNFPTIDEYAFLPSRFETRTCRVFLGLDLELGEVHANVA